ncbi:type II toxin-antitoxin system HicA family toxin [Liquorilactobacillus hordei]|uniref:type II toxin-antitoxin system HicA family toxin n=1 Tax=Liquorilactobacillus hordei TaxID=468911 RepID=UPI0039EA3CB5
MPMKTRDFVKLLKANGFKKVSQAGSHAKFVKDDKTVIVPMHARELPKGIEHSMRKQAGL